MKKITLLFAMLLFSVVGFSQCINGTAYGTYAALNTGLSETADTCTYGGEYNEISGLVIGNDYDFTAIENTPVTDKYITITDASDVVIAHGMSPLSVIAITATDIRLHVTDDAVCATTSACHTTTIQCVSPSCVPPSAPANDALCNAIAITIDVAGVAGVYTNIAATEETSEPVGSCYTGGTQGSVWFSFVAPASGEVQVSTDIGGTMDDSEIAVYDASGVNCADLSTLPAELTCDQDSGTVVGSGYMNVLDMTVANTNSVIPGNTYYIQVSGYSDNRGTFGIQVFDQLTLSVDDLVLTKGFKYYPNPVKDRLTVSAKNEIKQLLIVNMLGQTVRTISPNSRDYQLDFSDLSSGIYFVKASVDNTEGTFRIVKK